MMGYLGHSPACATVPRPTTITTASDTNISMPSHQPVNKRAKTQEFSAGTNADILIIMREDVSGTLADGLYDTLPTLTSGEQLSYNCQPSVQLDHYWLTSAAAAPLRQAGRSWAPPPTTTTTTDVEVGLVGGWEADWTIVNIHRRQVPPASCTLKLYIFTPSLHFCFLIDDKRTMKFVLFLRAESVDALMGIIHTALVWSSLSFPWIMFCYSASGEPKFL